MFDTPAPLTLEIVSHCWNYSRLLTYQLSSLLLFSPRKVAVTMTVFYTEEDAHTCRTLEYFGDQRAENVTWRWWPIDRQLLFRRSIGRNMAALDTKADWVWFADCDEMFREGCLDSLAEFLPAHTGPLVFPRCVNVTDHIRLDDPLLKRAEDGPAILDIDPADFHPSLQEKAIGGIQIARGDVLRSIGYCNGRPKCLRPARRMTRCREDTVFRRIIGTNGVPLDIPSLYRITHGNKGRSLFSWRWRL